MKSEITQHLERLRQGDDEALEGLIPLLYDDLRRLAGSWLRGERAGHTLTPTALVHETYLRLLDQRRVGASDRTQFLAAAGTMMRRILVDYARTRKREKRGGGQQPMALHEVEEFLAVEEAEEVIALDQALDELAAANPRGAKVVECRFFAGLDVEQTAELLAVSTKTVQRDWIAARAWLRHQVDLSVDA